MIIDIFVTNNFLRDERGGASIPSTQNSCVHASMGGTKLIINARATSHLTRHRERTNDDGRRNEKTCVSSNALIDKQRQVSGRVQFHSISISIHFTRKGKDNDFITD
jgi:hypothetical protein